MIGSKQNEIFSMILEIVAQEHGRHLRLINGREIVARLLRDREARAVIDAVRQQQQPDASAELLAANFVAAFGEVARTIGSEWHSRVEALPLDGEWFFRDKIQSVPSYEKPRRMPGAARQ